MKEERPVKTTASTKPSKSAKKPCTSTRLTSLHFNELLSEDKFIIKPIGTL